MFGWHEHLRANRGFLRRRALGWLTLGLALLAPGCGASRPPDAKVAPPQVTKTERYILTGVVRRVEPENEHVTIKHDEIKGFMGAMTMRFLVRNQPVIKEIKVGDHVQGVLKVESKDGVVQSYELTNLQVTRHAPAENWVIDVAGSEVALGPKRLEPGEAVPDFTMTGMDGKTFKLSDMRGFVVVITFVYTRCPLPEFCPYMDRKFAELAGRLGAIKSRAEKVRLISLSFDAEHDTPEVLRKHAQARGAQPPLWTYANITDSELSKVAGRFGLIYGENGREFAHNLCTVVIDREGKLARLAVGTAANHFETADMIKTIVSLLPR